MDADIKSLPLRDRKKLQQRTALLKVALQLFRDQGFESARMEDIARIAEVSIPTVYNYFANKRDVLVEVLKQDRQDALPLYDAVLKNPPGTPAEAFAALIYANVSIIRRPADKRLWREILAAVARSHDREKDSFEANHRVFKDYIERLLRHFIEAGKLSADLPLEIAADVIYAVNSQNLRHLASSERSSPEKIRELALKQIEFVLDRWSVNTSVSTTRGKPVKHKQ